MRSKKVKFISLGILVFIIIGCSKHPKITGKVKDNFGNPIKGAIVKIDGTTYKSETSGSGEYSVPYVPGKVSVSISANGYNNSSLKFDIATETTFPAEDVTLLKYPPHPGIWLFGEKEYLELKSSPVKKYSNRGDTYYQIDTLKYDPFSGTQKVRFLDYKTNKPYIFCQLEQEEADVIKTSKTFLVVDILHPSYCLREKAQGNYSADIKEVYYEVSTKNLYGFIPVKYLLTGEPAPAENDVAYLLSTWTSGVRPPFYFAKAKVLNNIKLYSSIATHDTKTNDGIAPEGYPIGSVMGVLKPGDIIKLIRMFPNYSESRYTFKVKTERGTIGYILPYGFTMTEITGDKGAIVSVHFERPYGFEGNLQAVDKMIGKYDKFVQDYPNSEFMPEASLNTLGLHLYALQAELNKPSRLDKIMTILKNLSADTKYADNFRNATKELSQFISEHQSDLLNSKTNYDILRGAQDRQQALLLLVPSSLSLGKNEKS